MSRSYKKHPTVSNRIKKSLHKRWVNKKVRHTEDLPSGRTYVRISPLKDKTEIVSLEEMLKLYETDKNLQAQFENEEELRKFWKLNYLSK